MEILLIILIPIMLMVIILIGRLVFAKDLKGFHFHFGFKTGLDISGSFYNRK